MNAFVILLGAAFISSMMPALAEIALSNFSIGLPDSSLSTANSVFNYAEFNNSSAINESVKATMLKLPLSFIENRGQSSDDTKFIVKTSGQTVFFTPAEVVFTLSSGNNSSVVHMSFEGSRPGQITGEQLLPGTANFFLGNDSSKWLADIPTYDAVRYKDLYPGVDLVFKGTEGYLKHELILSPGADLSQIVLDYSGHDDLCLTEDGSVLIRTAAGNLTDSAPICYQEIDDSRVEVEVQYRLIRDQRIGFDIGKYDRRYPLVIDPALVYSTYLGGSSSDWYSDWDNGITVDSSGNAYVTGHTESTDFPTKNPIQGSKVGGTFYADVFITKINAAGSALVYSTYLGGSSGDVGYDIAVDDVGNAYVAGATDSTNFPTKNPIQASNAGSNDAFVTKINADGSTLIYSTYLGGSGSDPAYGIAIDGSSNAYLTGITGSADFPTTNPIQASYAGGKDAFVTKINAAGSALVYSTYLGGNSNEEDDDIAVDNSGNAYVTGFHWSSVKTRFKYRPLVLI